MKFEITPSFISDVRRLKPEHLATFRKVLREKFVPACDAHAADPAVSWPASLRVKSVRLAPGILEMTWSFASPDGRATFELVTVDGEMRVRWRRVGDHDSPPTDAVRGHEFTTSPAASAAYTRTVRRGERSRINAHDTPGTTSGVFSRAGSL